MKTKFYTQVVVKNSYLCRQFYIETNVVYVFPGMSVTFKNWTRKALIVDYVIDQQLIVVQIESDELERNDDSNNQLKARANELISSGWTEY